MRRKIKVTHIINSMEVGGAQIQLVNFLTHLDRGKFEFRLICLAGKGLLGEQLERDGFAVDALGKSGRVHPAMLRRLVSLLRESRPDIVHCSVFTANLWGRLAAIFAGTPVLIAHEQSTVSLEKWYRMALDRLLALRTWRVLTVSENLRRRVVAEEGIDPAKVRVLHNAIDTAWFSRSGGEAARLPGAEGLRIGAVGRLEYRKNHLMLVRAAAAVVRTVPGTVFFLAGEGPERPRLEAEIERLGLKDNFLLLGERRDVPQLLRSFDVYALSSDTEGLSLSIMEAMAAGCAVAATDVGGNSELLDGGRAGLLTPPGDAEGMAAALIRLLENAAERRALALAAERRARECFDIQVVSRELEGIYLEAVEGAGKNV